MYSTGLERFISVDPLVIEYPSWTPYMYAMGRVIEGMDLEGLEFVDAKMRMMEAARVSEKREDITFDRVYARYATAYARDTGYEIQATT